MIKAINLSTYQYDMDRYNNNYKNVNKFLEDNNINAIELFGLQLYNEELIPKDKIIGAHLMHYPVWLDFWNEDEEGVFEEFSSKEDIINYYGNLDKKVIIDKYREEIKIAEKLNAEYAVFHVSNVRTKDCFNYEFTYTDKEVVDATIEIVNEIFKGLDNNITILFENLWWPGLKMTDPELVRYFIENIEYENKGIMLDTGHLLNTNLDINNEEEVIKIAKDCEIDFKDNNIYLNGEILKDEIRTMEVSNNVSNVAKIKEVRYLMVDVQRNIGKVSSVILDGRDIGSYVFPNADYKFFLVATPEERGKRRYKELVNKGYDVNLEEIISDIIKRDEIDSNREFAPLVKADDAIEIDTTGKSINEVVQSVLSKINI